MEIMFSRDGRPCLCQKLTEQTVTIGRGPCNHIQLTDEEISRRHCVIEKKEQTYIIKDLSTNGTFLNNEMVSESAIEVGDTISIGRWVLNVVEKADSSNRETVVSHKDPTSIIDFDVGQKIISTQKFLLTITPSGEKPYITTTAKLDLVFGTMPSCDIPVEDSFVSRRHCRLWFENNEIFLMDLNSTNGTYINGKKAEKNAAPLESSFKIGKTVVCYKFEKEKEQLKPSKKNSLGPMVGNSLAMRETFALIEKVASSDVTILITGESGTGKDLVAQLLHEMSCRSNKQLVSVNCGALPASIIESQLFGHERGSFTGATERMVGLFEQANGGTLFLDEIGEMPFELQTRLLRVLETKKIRRLGGKNDIDVDFRLVAATNKELQPMVNSNRFRQDLFYRLYVVPIELKPLRERSDDVKLLCEKFLQEMTPKGKHVELSKETMRKLKEHTWPGNVRELKNVIQRSIVLANSNIIEADEISFAPLESEKTSEYSLEIKEKNAIVDALRANKGNQSKAARDLGIARTTISSKILRYRIDIDEI